MFNCYPAEGDGGTSGDGDHIFLILTGAGDGCSIGDGVVSRDGREVDCFLTPYPLYDCAQKGNNNVEFLFLFCVGL